MRSSSIRSEQATPSPPAPDPDGADAREQAAELQRSVRICMRISMPTGCRRYTQTAFAFREARLALDVGRCQGKKAQSELVQSDQGEIF
jgi:hypothetical protein